MPERTTRLLVAVPQGDADTPEGHASLSFAKVGRNVRALLQSLAVR